MTTRTKLIALCIMALMVPCSLGTFANDDVEEGHSPHKVPKVRQHSASYNELSKLILVTFHDNVDEAEVCIIHDNLPIFTDELRNIENGAVIPYSVDGYTGCITVLLTANKNTIELGSFYLY